MREPSARRRVSGAQAFCASKTLAQAEFISAEHFNLVRAPKMARPFWEVTQKQLDELHIALVKPEE